MRSSCPHTRSFHQNTCGRFLSCLPCIADIIGYIRRFSINVHIFQKFMCNFSINISLFFNENFCRTFMSKYFTYSVHLSHFCTYPVFSEYSENRVHVRNYSTDFQPHSSFFIACDVLNLIKHMNEFHMSCESE